MPKISKKTNMIQEERKHKEKKKNNKHAAIKHATYMSSIKKT